MNESQSISGTTSNDRLTVPTPCAQCEYDLQGISSNSRCPECGLEIVASLRDDRLYLEEIPTLQRIGRGLTLTAICIAIAQAIARYPHVTANNYITWRASSFVVMCFECVGTWQLTRPLRQPVSSRARRFARISIFFDPLACLISTLTFLLPSILTEIYFLSGRHFSDYWFPLSEWLRRAYVFLATCACLGFAARAIYLGAVAGRIPNKKLSQFSRITAWVLTVCAVFSLIFHAGFALSFGVSIAWEQTRYLMHYIPVLNAFTTITSAMEIIMMLSMAARVTRARRQHQARIASDNPATRRP